MIRSGLLRLLLALSLPGLAACGSKGPLYLPENAPKRSAKPAATPAPPSPATRETTPSTPSGRGAATPSTGAPGEEATPSSPADTPPPGKN